MEVTLVHIFSLLLLLVEPGLVHAQQPYVNNKQLDCYNHYNSTDGNVCNGAQPNCTSYLTFRSKSPFTSPVSIAYLLNSNPSLISSINDITTVDSIPEDTPVVVPVNCSCSGGYYQHAAVHKLELAGETYFTVANNTYQGLTTCQAMIADNSYGDRNLTKGMDLEVPLRCACPTRNQTAAGFNYLLTYLVTWGDTFSSIAAMFGVDEQSVYDANMLSSTDLIFPFTPLLIPLRSEPTKIQLSPAAPPPAGSPPTTIVPVGGDSGSSKKWVFVGAGIGAALLVLLLVSGLLFWLRRRSRKEKTQTLPSSGPKKMIDSAEYSSLPENKSWSVSSEGIRVAIESLTLYKFEDLQVATGDFSEANRIQASVYKGRFKGDNAAVKIMKGDVSGEINILKQINHTNIIRLSGFCLHQGNTYLVYEFAENGSLSDWLHSNKNQPTLSWKQRVQIAYDIADGLSYLHNYTNPPYVHKNLKSSNILLDGSMRAKIGNFGSARSIESDDEGELQLTRNVVGTKGYMAPEYIENGVITPKLDVFAFGVVILELLSGKEAAAGDKNGEEVLSASIVKVLQGENVREKLKEFMDPRLKQEYPLDLAFSLAQLAQGCVAPDFNSRMAVSEVFMTLSKILSSTLDWDPSDAFDNSRSFGGSGR